MYCASPSLPGFVDTAAVRTFVGRGSGEGFQKQQHYGVCAGHVAENIHLSGRTYVIDTGLAS